MGHQRTWLRVDVEWGLTLSWGLKDNQFIITWEGGGMQMGVGSHSWKDDFQDSAQAAQSMVKTEPLHAKRCLSLSD